MVMFVMSVNPVTGVVSRSSVVGGPIVRITAVITVRIRSIIPGISVVAVSIRGVTESNPYAETQPLSPGNQDRCRGLGVRKLGRNEGQPTYRKCN